jgi:hypothetical protein
MTREPDGTVVSESKPPRSLREAYFDLGRALLTHDRSQEAVSAFEHALEEQGPQPRPFDMTSCSSWARVTTAPATPKRRYVPICALPPASRSKSRTRYLMPLNF